MIKIILLLVCLVSYGNNKMIGKVKISYDMNSTNIDEASLFISKDIKSGSIISGYKIEIKNVGNKFMLNKANIFFKNNMGKVIIGKSKNRNNVVYELANRFELIGEYFLKKDKEIEKISYISPAIYDNITEFDYSKKNDLKIFRSIWIKNNLKTSMFYIFHPLNEVLGIGLHKKTKVVDFGWSYEDIKDISTTHSMGLIYKLKNYHYKSLYIFNSLDEELLINGLDIYFLQNGVDEARVYLESSYLGGNDMIKVGASFSF